MYPRLKTIVRAALGKIARHLYSRRHLARAAVAKCGSSRRSTDHRPARITFGGLTAHDFNLPGRTHHYWLVLSRRRLRYRTACFAVLQRNSASSRKNARNAVRAFQIDCPNSIATVDSARPCPIPRGDHHHQISIGSNAARGFVQ